MRAFRSPVRLMSIELLVVGLGLGVLVARGRREDQEVTLLRDALMVAVGRKEVQAEPCTRQASAPWPRRSAPLSGKRTTPSSDPCGIVPRVTLLSAGLWPGRCGVDKPQLHDVFARRL